MIALVLSIACMGVNDSISFKYSMGVNDSISFKLVWVLSIALVLSIAWVLMIISFKIALVLSKHGC